MKVIPFSNFGRRCLQVTLLLAILFFNFGVNGVITAQAAPGNDAFPNRLVISLPFNPGPLDTTNANYELGEPEFPSNVGGCEGKLLRAGLATVWYEYTAGASVPVFFNTSGSFTNEPDPFNPPNNYQYDTYIAVFTSTVSNPGLGDLTLLACNDNPDNDTNQAQLAINVVSGTKYYIQVAEYNGELNIPYGDPGYNGGTLIFSMTTGLTISGNAGMAAAKVSYPGGSAIADGTGNYSLPIPSGYTGIVKTSKSGYLFAPAAKQYTNVTTNKTGENYNLYSVSPADFNGDGKTDVAVFRPSENKWYISGVGSTPFGLSGDIPVPADYNGDGKDEIAVYRPTNSTWYISGQSSIAYGQVGDIPVVADYNGDGMADIAVFRQSNSTWYIRGVGSFAYGTVGDIPVVADYDGDGKANIAVFRPTNSTWYLYGIGPRLYGTVGDVPVVADYNGDGKADIAVFRPTNSTWYLYAIGPRVYGTVGDIPAIGDYNGDGLADITVFRPSNSTWYKYGVGPSVYGTVGDIPV